MQIINPYRFGGSLYGDDMVLVMATTGAAETVTIPCQNVGTFNAEIDWGDGEATSTITTYNDADLAHEYAVAGDYTIRISGTFPNIYFNTSGDYLKLKEVIQFGDTGLTRLNSAFRGCANLTSVSGASNLSNVTRFDLIFFGCGASLTTLDVADWDMSSATNLSYFAWGCSNLTTLDVSGWDVSTVSVFFLAFSSCSGLTELDVSGWVTTSATNMQGIFQHCSGLTSIDVSGWDLTGVSTISSIFFSCTGLTTDPDVSGWDTSTVTNMYAAFRNSSVTDVDVDLWDIEAVTDYRLMFGGVTLSTSKYDEILVAWDAQNPQDSETVDFGSSTYTDPSAAATARANLISTDSWTINDGGTA